MKYFNVGDDDSDMSDDSDDEDSENSDRGKKKQLKKPLIEMDLVKDKSGPVKKV